MLIRLVYASRAHSKMPLDLKEILEVSRLNNPALRITGAMCFLDGVYLQYLEGEAMSVDALYQRISRDPRHADPVVLDRCAIEKRTFMTWSMALLTWNDESREIFAKFSPNKVIDLYNIDPSVIVPTFRALASSSNWAVIP